MSEIVWEVEKEIDGELLRVEITYDEDPLSPRDNDNLGTIVGYNRTYRAYDVRSENNDKYVSWDDWRKGELPKDCYCLPVYAYIHGDIALSTEPYGDRWDSGQLGYIYATRPKMREWFDKKTVSKKVKEDTYKMFKSEIEEFSNYLSGTHYIVTFFEDGAHVESWGGHLHSKSMIDDMFEIVEEKFDPLKVMLKELA